MNNYSKLGFGWVVVVLLIGSVMIFAGPADGQVSTELSFGTMVRCSVQEMTATIDNEGSSDVSVSDVELQMPAGFSFEETTAVQNCSPDGNPTPGSSTLSWTFSSCVLTPGSSLAITFRTEIDSGASSGTITNGLMVATSSGTSNSSVSYNVSAHDLDCSIAIDPDYLYEGETATLDATVSGGSGSIASYDWNDDGAGGTFSNASIEDPTWTAPAGFSEAADLKLSIADDLGCTADCVRKAYPLEDESSLECTSFIRNGSGAPLKGKTLPCRWRVVMPSSGHIMQLFFTWAIHLFSLRP